jgi:hypothetical protein
MKLSRDGMKALFAYVERAPSVHNVQMARWRLFDSNCLELYENTAVRLKIADPTGKDAQMSLGSSWESLSLAATCFGLKVENIEIDENALHPLEKNLKLIARCRLVHNAESEEPLAKWILKRKSDRRPFVHVEPEFLSKALTEMRHFMGDGVRIVSDSQQIKSLAGWADDAIFASYQNPDYIKELKEWCRFTKKHPRWELDGLNADCLGLSRLEALGASAMLSPGVFAGLSLASKVLPGNDHGLKTTLGDGRMICASNAIVFLVGEKTGSHFDQGRSMMRSWLQLASLGWSAAPVSSLVDDTNLNQLISKSLGLKENQVLYYALRAGYQVPTQPANSPRLASDVVFI